MSLADALQDAGNKPAGKRPYFLTPEVERVLAITMAVAQELAVARQRIDTLERLLQAHGVLAEGEIDAYSPAPQAAIERAQWNQEYLARILRIVQQQAEAAAAAGELASEEVAREVSGDGSRSRPSPLPSPADAGEGVSEASLSAAPRPPTHSTTRP
jgi:hypothetical protein